MSGSEEAQQRPDACDALSILHKERPELGPLTIAVDHTAREMVIYCEREPSEDAKALAFSRRVSGPYSVKWKIERPGLEPQEG